MICTRSGFKQKQKLLPCSWMDGDASASTDSGFTLIEIMAVVFVLSVVALIVVPSLNPSEPYEIELLAREIATAYRHARGEALRTSNPYGVHVEASAKRVRVLRDATGSMPPVPVYDVYQPIAKQPYELDLQGAQGITLTQSTTWSSACNVPDFLYFDAWGRPRCGDPWGTLLDTGSLTLTRSGHSRVVVIEGETGRVTVQ